MAFEQLLDTLDYGIIAIDRNGDIFFFNKAFSSSMELNKNIIGKPFKGVVNDDKMLQVLNTGKSLSLETITLNNKTFLVNRIPVKENKEVIAAVLIFKEITSLESITFEISNAIQKENEVNAVIDAMKFGVLILDENGVVSKINDALSQATELSSSDFLERDMETLHRKGLIKHQSIALTSLNKKKPVTDFQCICTGRELVINAIPVVNQKGEVFTVPSTVTDVTDFNQLQMELEDASWLSNLYRSSFRQPLTGSNMFKENFITRNSKMLNILDFVKRIAKIKSTVLVLGESGVGKELIVENIHKWSASKGKLIKINCNAIPEELLESELFGYEEGAFTGAKKRGKPGAFELANNGTIFLDEIGDLSFAMQTKLLRVLEETKLLRLGGTEPIEVNPRIIAATNQDLTERIKKGKFREDLYYRLNVLPINIPPLRERTEDIPILLCYYLSQFNAKYQLQKSISPIVINVFAKYRWPGNVRELKNVLERMILASNSDVIQEDDIPDYITNEVGSPKGNSLEISSDFKLDLSNISLQAAKDKLEVFILKEAIKKHNSLREVSKAIGLSHTAIIKKVRKHGLEIKETK